MPGAWKIPSRSISRRSKKHSPRTHQTPPPVSHEHSPTAGRQNTSPRENLSDGRRSRGLEYHRVEVPQHAGLRPSARVRIEYEVGDEFSQRLAITVERVGRRQAPEPQHAEGSARLPPGLVVACGIQLRTFDVHLIRLALQVGGQPEPRDLPELVGARVPLAEIHRVHELVRENLCREEVAGLATEVIA